MATVIETPPTVLDLPHEKYCRHLIDAGLERHAVEFVGEECVKIRGKIYRCLNPASPPHIFRPCGEYYQIKFARLEVLLRRHVGFDHIHEIMRNPGKVLGCIELMDLSMEKRREGGSKGKSLITQDTAMSEGLQVDNAEEDWLGIDEKTIAVLLKKKRDLEEESIAARDSGDIEEYQRLDLDAGKIEDYLNQHTYDGKPKPEGCDRSKARKAVSIAITRALQSLKIHHPPLAAFLKPPRITMGFTFCYVPDSAVKFISD